MGKLIKSKVVALFLAFSGFTGSNSQSQTISIPSGSYSVFIPSPGTVEWGPNWVKFTWGSPQPNPTPPQPPTPNPGPPQPPAPPTPPAPTHTGKLWITWVYDQSSTGQLLAAERVRLVTQQSTLLNGLNASAQAIEVSQQALDNSGLRPFLQNAVLPTVLIQEQTSNSSTAPVIAVLRNVKSADDVVNEIKILRNINAPQMKKAA